MTGTPGLAFHSLDNSFSGSKCRCSAGSTLIYIKILQYPRPRATRWGRAHWSDWSSWQRAREEPAALQDYSPVYVRLRVIFDPRGRSDTSLFVRFAPKATFTNQDVIRRSVPKAT
jgi:hypothetical protein